MQTTLDPLGGNRVAQSGKAQPQAGTREARARETAEDFEAMFIAQMLNAMKLGVDPDSAFGGGAGEEAFQSQMAEEYGKSMAKVGGIGVADAIYKAILRAQEGT